MPNAFGFGLDLERIVASVTPVIDIGDGSEWTKRSGGNSAAQVVVGIEAGLGIVLAGFAGSGIVAKHAVGEDTFKFCRPPGCDDCESPHSPWSTRHYRAALVRR